jgi:transglutaminase-like putative cysteine protease
LELSEIPAHFLEFLLPSRYCEVGFRERVGVCRDFTHLAFTLCRCMNIPARYATGYLGDIGVAPDPNPMDFSAWFDVFLQGQWYTFDARHNRRRIGRVLIGLGRDAADVPITMAFGKESLEGFRVLTEEIVDFAAVPDALTAKAA